MQLVRQTNCLAICPGRVQTEEVKLKGKSCTFDMCFNSIQFKETRHLSMHAVTIAHREVATKGRLCNCTVCMEVIGSCLALKH